MDVCLPYLKKLRRQQTVTEELGELLGKSILESSFSNFSSESVIFANGSVNLPFKIQNIHTEFIQTEVKIKKEMQTGFRGWEKKIDQWALVQKKRFASCSLFSIPNLSNNDLLCSNHLCANVCRGGAH